VSSDAIAIMREATAWRARALDLEAAEDLDSLIDQLRDDHSPAAVAFVDQDDEWLAVIRLTGDDDSRVFLSDSRFIASSELAERLFGDALPPAAPRPDDDLNTSSLRPVAEPVGDIELLADLGVPGDVLVELVAEEGALPSDVIAALCERLGAAAAYETVRI
jgi:putative tRNA adenosine deaminase-associated protein